MYERGKQTTFNPYVVYLIVFLYLSITIAFFLELFGVVSYHFGFLVVAGYSKAIITLVKYIPQVYLNTQRKSCVGLSMTNVIFDFSGGLLSFIQEGIDS